MPVADSHISVGQVYLHVSNSGVTFEVVDGPSGPTIRIHTSTFGNLVTEQTYYVDQNGLQKLADLFQKAANHEYREPAYCIAACPLGEVGAGDCEGSADCQTISEC